MSVPYVTDVELTVEPTGAFEAMALEGAGKYTAAIDPWAAEPRGYAPHEPSTLGLLLVGVATLAAYRGLVGALGSGQTKRRADDGLIKPRRRAA